MKFLAAVTAIASLASASPFYVVEKRAATPLTVKLQPVGDSEIKATFTNHGNSTLRVLKTGSILDKADVQKVRVTSGAHNVRFEGIRLQIDTKALPDSSFQRIPIGGSVSSTFDIAHVHDLSKGGEYGVTADGFFAYAEEGSNTLVGSVPFVSDKVYTKINGNKAKAAHAAYHNKRTNLQGACKGDKLAATSAALSRCSSLAKKAQQAAIYGPGERIEEYFKSNHNETRSVVSTVFSRVAAECASTKKGHANYLCSDVLGACEAGVLAYTLPSSNTIVFCDSYFKLLPASPSVCHGQDQATTTIHELTHLARIKGTEDFGGSGYEFVRSLTSRQNINHADTYALFANAVQQGC